MDHKGKSPIEQAARAASALLAVEKWNLEAQRADVERIEKALDLGRPGGDWSAFIVSSAADWPYINEQISTGRIDAPQGVRCGPL